jgi:hypothetical protein
MDIDSLPARLYLLTYDETKQRTGKQAHLGLTLRAAALSELFLAGHLLDVDGRAHVGRPGAGGAKAARSAKAAKAAAPAAASAATEPLDPLLRTMLDEIAASRPRRWKHWVQRRARHWPGQVRTELAEQGVLRVDRSTVLGVIPRSRVTARDRRAVKALLEQTRRTMRGTSMSPPTPRQAATVALAAAAGYRSVATRRELRAYRSIVADLSETAGPVIPALRRAIRDEQSAG